MYEEQNPSSSGVVVTTNVPVNTSASPTSVTTVSLRPQDVQAIVTGLTSNPDALSAVDLMIREEQQQNPVSTNQSELVLRAILYPISTTRPHHHGSVPLSILVLLPRSRRE